jgi:hypothetical protein
LGRGESSRSHPGHAEEHRSRRAIIDFSSVVGLHR